MDTAKQTDKCTQKHIFLVEVVNIVTPVNVKLPYLFNRPDREKIQST